MLNTLCSFDLVPASDYLDLDWADEGLIRMCEHTGIGDVSALRRATDGDAEVNPAALYMVMEQPALRDFYAAAADRRLAIVVWCD
ncbi:hypothetical protein Airi02_103550 [Actinoallomurus iriomotensis]|uniref:Uncharacterized protein n=1 Tax=Actinoallomurus iriomotensis TaxID=478107 RepID=A0A9W6SHR2_9ACTN|nr:hypothetical protein Airi02_103550 [Actinoallomurus iriomotensis]